MVVEATKEYAALARANGMTPAQMALAWCYSRWFVASTIIGATTLAQFWRLVERGADQITTDDPEGFFAEKLFANAPESERSD